MRRWQTWVGIVGLLLLCGCGASILAPIFASAKAAARMTRDLLDAKRFSEAVARYGDTHRGLLPGKDWRNQIAGIDPSLTEVLGREDGEWTVGYAAVPGTLGRTFEELPPETVLYVEYRSTKPIDILREVQTIGDVHLTGRAFAITVQNVLEGGAQPQSLARIGLLLGRQGVKGLK